MKKVIALALAMMLALSMVSMAAVENVITGSPADHENSYGSMDNQMLPGNEYHFTVDSGSISGLTFNTDNFSISSKWTKGSADVASVKIKNKCGNLAEAHLIIELKENYTISELKDLVGTITFTAKKAGGSVTKGEKFQLTLDAMTPDGQFSNDVEEIDGATNKDDATEIDAQDNTIYKMNSAGWVSFSSESRLAHFKVRLPEDKKVFAFFREKPIEAIEDKYYDLDADIAYYDFVAKPNLGTKADVALQGDFSDKYHVYEYANGKLTEIKDAKWNADDGVYEFKTSQLTAYVISDKELKGAVASSEPAETTDDNTTVKNPDTGANDVVGVAVALAVVSLVAAGAVSLKK